MSSRLRKTRSSLLPRSTNQNVPVEYYTYPPLPQQPRRSPEQRRSTPRSRLSMSTWTGHFGLRQKMSSMSLHSRHMTPEEEKRQSVHLALALPPDYLDLPPDYPFDDILDCMTNIQRHEHQEQPQQQQQQGYQQLQPPLPAQPIPLSPCSVYRQDLVPPSSPVSPLDWNAYFSSLSLTQTTSSEDATLSQPFDTFNYTTQRCQVESNKLVPPTPILTLEEREMAHYARQVHWRP